MQVVGGGGKTTDASDLTSGTLDAARLPGVLANVDTQAELLSAAAAAAASHTHAIGDTTGLQTALDGKAAASHTHSASDISSGTVATARLGSGTADSTTFLRGDQAWAAPTDATKLPTAGGTMTGALGFSGTQTSAGASVANIFRDSTGDLNYNVDTGDVHDFTSNGFSRATISEYGIRFDLNHVTPASTAHAVWRDTNSGTIVQAPSTGVAYLSANQNLAPRFYAIGPSNATSPGMTTVQPIGVSLAAAGTRTVTTSATTKSGTVVVINSTDYKRATFSVEAGVPTKIEGDASFVAGRPGASQIGLELSSTTLRINNGYATAKLLTVHSVLA